MKALLLAPQPFFVQRGTPIAVRQLLEVFSSRGWEVDLLTFPGGRPVDLPGVRTFQTRRLPWVRTVPPGLSLRKIIYDILMLFRAVSMASRGQYQYVHWGEEYQHRCRKMRVAEQVRFVGEQPIAALPGLIAGAEVMVSPRLGGENTPMKIYSYMDSGKPILATDIPAHSQVLPPGAAMLVPPEPEALAEGMLRLAGDAGLRARLGETARQIARDEYSAATFHRRAGEFCDAIEAHPEVLARRPLS
jgi:hypothetical protein